MKKIILPILSFIILISLCGCNQDKSLTEKESPYTIQEINNISTDIYDISSTGATIVIKDNNKEPYTYDEWYAIEKEENGKWYQLSTIPEEYGFNDLGYIVDDHNEVKFTIDWEWLYGQLEEGHYRILKQINNKYISIPFNI